MGASLFSDDITRRIQVAADEDDAHFLGHRGSGWESLLEQTWIDCMFSLTRILVFLWIFLANASDSLIDPAGLLRIPCVRA